EPAGLDVHHVDQREVELVVEDGSASEFFEALGSGDVIDVGVGDDDLPEGELVLLEQLDDAGDVVAGIDDDGFAGGFVAKDGTVALERAYDKDFVDHAFRVKADDRICLERNERSARKGLKAEMRKPVACALVKN
ncbi:MAG: hypothetical protein WBQ21_06730, partial [Solirubrobacteraceae bacterium]